MTTNDVTKRTPRTLDNGGDRSLCSQAFGIDASGASVGISVLDGRSRAVLFAPDGGDIIELAPEAGNAIAEAISDNGSVAGTLGVGVKEALQPPGVIDSEILPFVWTRDGGLEVLPLPPGSEMGQAIDVNDAGLVLVTGAVPSSGGLPRGLPVGTFVYDLEHGTYTPLPVVEGVEDDVIALGHTLDSRGGVAGGFVKLEGEFNWRHSPGVWAPETLEPVRLQGDDAFVNACTTDELSVGWQMTQQGQPPTAVLWRDLTAPPESLPGQAALRVNDAGLVVGIEALRDSHGLPFAAVLWDCEGRSALLEHLGGGSYAYGINSQGDVVGYVVDATSADGPAARAAIWPAD
jgi:hypothetical protein